MKTTIKSALLILCISMMSTGCQKECDSECDAIGGKMVRAIATYDYYLSEGDIDVDEYKMLVNQAIDRANSEGNAMPKYCDCWEHIDNI